MKITPVVKQLLIINIIFFIGAQLVPVSYEYLALFFPENPGFKVWQPITHMFMHGGVAHIAFNMFALYSFGSTLEHFLGRKEILVFLYFLWIRSCIGEFCSELLFLSGRIKYFDSQRI